MKNHPDILELLDYAQDLIDDKESIDNINNHLLNCVFCRKVLRSHFYFIAHKNEILDKFFPGIIAETESETLEEMPPVFSPAVLFDKVANKMIEYGKRIEDSSSGLISEIIQLLEELHAMPDSLSRNMQIIGQTYGESDTNLPDACLTIFEKSEIPIRLSLPREFQINDFIVELRYNSLDVIYDNDNFNELLNSRVTLFTMIWSPYVFETTFKIVDDVYALASVSVNDCDIIALPDFINKEQFDLFFLSID